MLAWFRRLMIGSPLPSSRAMHERLPKVLALPIFASDALSSVAYATEEILFILVVAGAAAVRSPIVFFISVAIAGLLAIVVTSYRQTVYSYPSGGGAYIVAKENLGNTAGLVAGAALTIDYTLTVAVSIAAGVAAVISAAPSTAPYRIEMALVGIAVLTLANLRGTRESGLIFALPTYLFITAALALICTAIYRLQTTGLVVPSGETEVIALRDLSLFLILRAFSGGCAAMTGTEAISNAVQAFRPPESRNAAATLIMMAVILGFLFLGIGYLAWQTGLIPVAHETVLSQLARATFGTSWLYYYLQAATAVILILAANTSFAGYPRLASVMARDRFLPRQLFNVGDRLVFSNGILVLALLAAILIIIFRGSVHALIPLYAVGIFVSFTLSQAGMVKLATRLRQPGWRLRASISGTGAVATGVVALVLAITKFRDGAFVVIALNPVLVYLFSKINSHYVTLGNKLRLTPEDNFKPLNNTVLVLTPSLHRGILPALEYAKDLSPDVRAIHVETDPVDTALLEERWEQWGGGIPLIILESPYRSLLGPLMEYLEEAKRERENYVITVIIPEFVPATWWAKLLHNQSGLVLKFALLFRRDIITTNVRYYLDK